MSRNVCVGLCRWLLSAAVPIVATAALCGPADATPATGIPLQPPHQEITTNPHAVIPDPVLNGSAMGNSLGSAAGSAAGALTGSATGSAGSATGSAGSLLGSLIGALIGALNPGAVPQVLP